MMENLELGIKYDNASMDPRHVSITSSLVTASWQCFRTLMHLDDALWGIWIRLGGGGRP